MKQSDDNSHTGTLTIVMVTLELTTKEQTRDLTMEDIARMLDECLAGRGELLVDDDPQRATAPSSLKRVLH